MPDKKFLPGSLKAFGEDSSVVIASTGDQDREGDVVNPMGWKLDNFMNNPVLLWSHDAHSLPIGKVLKIWNEGNALLAEISFASHEFAQKVKDLFKEKILNAFSVGYIPLEIDDRGVTQQQELLELSVVNVPANQNALAVQRMKSLEDSAKVFEAEIKAPKKKTPACRMEGESKNDCVSRKIPEIKAENPNMSQEQCVAMAENMCGEMCKLTDAPVQKEGRTISEKNRSVMRLAIDSMKEAQINLEELLQNTEPPIRETQAAEKQTIKISKAERPNKALRLLRIIDRAAEAATIQLKGGVKNE